MKKIILLALVVLGTACQKDYYLADLDYQLHANAELQKQINLLHQDLAEQISDNEAKAEELIALEDQILALTTELDETFTALGLSEGAVEDLKDKILQLEALVISTNAQIEALLAELDIALLQTEQDEDLIADLVQEITILENKEPEIIIEYVEVINTVTEYITEYVTEYIELPPNLTPVGQPDVITGGAAIFNRTDLDLVAGDTIWIVDWVEGDHQVVDLAAVNVGSASTTLIFSEDADTSATIIIFKLVH